VYLLDASWKPIVVGDRKITLAIGGAKPQVIVLVPGESSAYLVGHWRVVGQPPRVTVMIKRPGVTHVAIVGWHPGAKIVMVGGPRVKVKVKGVHWNGSGGPPTMVKIDVKEHAKGKGKFKMK
jgi:hypothetical protein